MLVTEAGRTIDVSDEQPLKALSSIEVIELESVIVFKALQPQKAPSPIASTESGIVSDVSELKPLKA